MVFFKKLDARQKVHLPDGSWLKFVDMQNGWGLLSTDNDYQIGQLRQCMAAHRGGIEEISYEDYEATKKKPETTSSANNYREILDIKKLSILLRKLSQGEDVAVDNDPYQMEGRWRKQEFCQPGKLEGWRPGAISAERWKEFQKT